MEKSEIATLREQLCCEKVERLSALVEKLSFRVTTLENELGALRVGLENSVEEPQPVPAAAGKRSPTRKSPPKPRTKKSNFEDDGKLYYVADYTEKSYAVFGKSALVLVDPVMKGFRMIRTEKMEFGPGATGPRAGGVPFIGAVRAEIAKRQLKLEIVETTRAQMTEWFGLAEAK